MMKYGRLRKVNVLYQKKKRRKRSYLLRLPAYKPNATATANETTNAIITIEPRGKLEVLLLGAPPK